MQEERKRMLEGLKRALQAEVDGENFYRMAANGTADTVGRATFENLAADEVEHFIFLRAQYDSIVQTGAVNLNVRLGKPSDAGESPIFSEGFKTRIKEAHHEMSALSIGVQLELAAIRLYRAEAEAASDPHVKAFYRELAEWEETHHRRLLRQQRELQDDYYFDNKFYPF